MFIGHYAVAMAAKRAAPRVSLGTLLLACQLVATAARAFWVLGGRGLVRPALRSARFTLACAWTYRRVCR